MPYIPFTLICMICTVFYTVQNMFGTEYNRSVQNVRNMLGTFRRPFGSNMDHSIHCVRGGHLNSALSLGWASPFKGAHIKVDRACMSPYPTPYTPTWAFTGFKYPTAYTPPHPYTQIQRVYKLGSRSRRCRSHSVFLLSEESILKFWDICIVEKNIEQHEGPNNEN